MFKLQIQWHKKGEWLPTVYPERDYASALELLKEYNKMWDNVHSYRIVPTR